MGALERHIAEMVSALVEERIAPLRAELERLRAANDAGPILPDEAARRLGITRRDVNRRLKDGRLEAEYQGGVRMVRWPPPSGLR